MIDNILPRLEKVSGGHGRWIARCPAHQDRSPSLSITEKDDKVVMKCHAGCQTEDILAAIGLEWKDLFSRPLTDRERDARKKFYSDKQKQMDETLLEVCKAARDRGEKICREDLELERKAWERLNG